MKETVGTRGLILNEPFLWERGGKGRTGYSLPRRDVAAAALPENLTGEGPDFPDLSEVEVVRHYTRLSTWNYGVDSGMYPLGSCTMKYNPKTNERQAALPGFSGAHPLVPSELCQGALQLIYELEHYLAHVAGLDAVRRKVIACCSTSRRSGNWRAAASPCCATPTTGFSLRSAISSCAAPASCWARARWDCPTTALASSPGTSS